MLSKRASLWITWGILLAIVVPFGYLYLIAGMRFFTVPSRSMLPTLQTADYFVTFPQTEYAAGDVVVLRDPQNSDGFVVKRIVATGGQFIRAEGGGIFVNGRYLSEPYMGEPMGYNMKELEVPPGHVFLLGDNRNESRDSHNWNADPENPKDPGSPMTIPVSEIIGRAHTIYLPFERIRRIRRYDLQALRAAS